jgi:sugar phosphate isomerase/epimerase
VKVGLLTAPYGDRTLAEILPELAALGVESIELGTGNHPGDAHCPLDELLDNPRAQDRLLVLLEEHGMTISALSQHGNPLHPQRDLAAVAHDTWRKTVQLAAQLGIPIVNAFSGCPGDSDKARHPNWVTCAWPTEYLDLLEWQWREKVIPYWQGEERFAARHGVKVAIEMHAGFVVYNPTSLLRLRQATGDSLGANFDPSHLFWQAIDPLEAIAEIAHEGAIFHVHAKDTRINPAAIGRKGILDVEPLTNVERRSWSFCTLGLGHDEQTWSRIINALRSTGYDYVVSIEHEDERLETEEAIRHSVRLLKRVLAGEPAGAAGTSSDGLMPTAGEPQHLLLEGGNR